MPLTDPAGSSWEGGWLSSPLWYLRTLLWILLLAPVGLWLLRRAPRLAAVGAVVHQNMKPKEALDLYRTAATARQSAQ